MARTTGPWRSTVKPHGLVAAEHSLQRQIADALRLEIAPPGKVSRDGVVWWSVDHASYAGTAPGARVGRGYCRAACRTRSCCTVVLRTWSKSRHRLANYRDPQQAVMSAVLVSGGRVGVARNAAEMLGLLDTWGGRGGSHCVQGRCMTVPGNQRRRQTISAKLKRASSSTGCPA